MNATRRDIHTFEKAIQDIRDIRMTPEEQARLDARVAAPGALEKAEAPHKKRRLDRSQPVC